MLTLEAVRTYKRFGGDIDGWARSVRVSAEDITDEEWSQLEQIVSKLTICRRGLGTEQFCKEAYTELGHLAPDENIREAILELVPSWFPSA